MHSTGSYSKMRKICFYLSSGAAVAYMWYRNKLCSLQPVLEINEFQMLDGIQDNKEGQRKKEERKGGRPFFYHHFHSLLLVI